ncbi:unnamed protein product [Parajaminaea phylloscopi]
MAGTTQPKVTRGKSATVAKAASAKASSSASASSSSSSSAEKLVHAHVSSAQASKAFKALQAHRLKHKTQQTQKSKDTGKSELPLDAEDDGEDVAVGAARTEDTVYLNVTVKRLDKNKKAKPVSIPLPHPVHDASTSTVCLFVKDPQREYKDLLPSLGVKCVHRIIGVSKLKGKFAPFEARRQLLDEYDMFLCDERIGPLMPKLLGSKWQQRKKMPISVNLVRTKHVKQELEKAVKASRFFANKGSTMSLPLGSVSRMTAGDFIENLETALPLVIKRVPYDGWQNVQNIEIKTGKSASLPIWSSDLKDRWVGVQSKGDDDDDEDSDDEGSEASDAAQKEQQAKPAKAKKAAPAVEKSETATTAPSKKRPSAVSSTEPAAATRPKKQRASSASKTA